MADYLFVYGTLLKGEFNNSLLNGCTLEDYCCVPGKLFDTGNGYPVAYYDKNLNSRIFGEHYKLPESHDELMASLDSYEGIPDNVYIRDEIVLNNKSTYIYTAADTDASKKFKEIGSGSWLRHGAWINNDPLSFALNFESAHKSYYRSSEKDKIIRLPGDSGILISAPHATNHTRKAKPKRFEVYTAAISVTMHSLTGAHCLYTNSVSSRDPNFYDDCSYKSKLVEIAEENKIRLLLDIHGTGEERNEDIYPGIGKDMEFLLGKRNILDSLYRCAERYGIRCGSTNKFPAYKQNTVAKYAAGKLHIPSMQLEINKRLRMPETHSDEYIKLIKFLTDFINSLRNKKRE